MYLKPRLRYRLKTWSCYLPDFLETRVYGVGYSPWEAYMDWLLAFNRYRLFGSK